MESSPSASPPAAEPSPVLSKTTKSENLWLNLGCNAVAPAVVLSFLSDASRLGPARALILALAFPLAYGAWDLISRRTWSLLALLGLVGTLLTGGLGLLEMSGFWFAVKEAAVPLLMGAAIPLSLCTRQPLVRTLLYNDQVLNVSRIRQALEEREQVAAFDRLLAGVSWVLGATLVLSASINFSLAWWLLPAMSGTEEFNYQLAKLQFWSWPGTFLPLAAGMFYASFRLMRGLEALTALKSGQLFHPTAR